MEISTKNILVVEDDLVDYRLLQEMFRDAQVGEVRFIHKTSLGEALQCLADEEVDLALLDLNLPDSLGLETLLRLLEEGVQVPVVVLTGADDQAMALKTLEYGAQDYLVKGRFDGAALWRALRYAMERWQAEQMLARARKMEAIGQLAGGIAHDFNNGLTIILNQAESLMRQLGPEHPGQMELGAIKEAAQKASDLTRQMLAFGRKQFSRPRLVDLNAVVRGDLGMLESLLGEDLQLQFKVQKGPGLVEIDPVQIQQILLNLCGNARDAMPSGGKLILETSKVELTEEAVRTRFRLEAEPGTYVVLAVTDTGGGMSQATINKIFEPFFTTKEVGKGTGLGLATVYGIVRQNKGAIWVYSEKGRGTTFKIYLPCVEGELPEVKKEPDVADLNGTERLLVVEDQPGVRKVLQKILGSRGYEVTLASSGIEAVELFEKNPDQFDLVLTDVVMPKMKGGEMVRRLRQIRPGLPAVYMSGYTTDTLDPGELDGSAGEVNFIEKPFTSKALAAKVRQVLDGKAGA